MERSKSVMLWLTQNESNWRMSPINPGGAGDPPTKGRWAETEEGLEGRVGGKKRNVRERRRPKGGEATEIFRYLYNT